MSDAQDARLNNSARTILNFKKPKLDNRKRQKLSFYTKRYLVCLLHSIPVAQRSIFKNKNLSSMLEN